MPVDTEFRTFILEMVEPLGPVSIRNMFGGAGVFYDGVMFGLVAGEQLYFKVDDTNRQSYEDEDCEPFTYSARNNKRAVMSYYQIPDFLYDEPDALVEWARSAVDVALRADAKKPKKKKKAKNKFQ